MFASGWLSRIQAKTLVRLEAGQDVVEDDQVIVVRPAQRGLDQRRVGDDVDDEVAVRQRRLDDRAGRGVVVQDQDADVARTIGVRGIDRLGLGAAAGVNAGLGVWVKRSSRSNGHDELTSDGSRADGAARARRGRAGAPAAAGGRAAASGSTTRT